jgi:hypothetical protein
MIAFLCHVWFRQNDNHRVELSLSGKGELKVGNNENILELNNDGGCTK